MEAEELELVQKADGEEWEIEIEKEPGQDLGLKFEHDYGQGAACRNKCIFCFVTSFQKECGKLCIIKMTIGGFLLIGKLYYPYQSV